MFRNLVHCFSAVCVLTVLGATLAEAQDIRFANFDLGRSIRDAAFGSGSSCDSCCRSKCCCTRVPNMIGDSIAGSLGFTFGTINSVSPIHFTKVADNNHTLPQDRISVSYNFFHNFESVNNTTTGSVIADSDISEYELIFERTFSDGLYSFQINIPFAHTVDFSHSFAKPGAEDEEFGNLGLTLKVLMVTRGDYSVSAGVLTEAPTAAPLTGDTGAGISASSNKVWQFSPFVAVLHSPNDRRFAQFFISHRTRTGSERTTFNGAPTGTVALPNCLLVDGSYGWWMVQNRDGLIRGLAPTIELHYMMSTTNSANLTNEDTLTMTAGMTAAMANGGTVALGWVVPLRGKRETAGNFAGFNTDRRFDWELAFQVNLFTR